MAIVEMNNGCVKMTAERGTIKHKVAHRRVTIMQTRTRNVCKVGITATTNVRA